MLINTMEEESLSEGMVSQITVEYKMFVGIHAISMCLHPCDGSGNLSV